MTKRQNKTKGKVPNIPPPDTSEASDTPYARIDFDEFMHFLDGSGWSEGEKIAYLQKCWEIVVQFAAIGFDVHPVQQACGQVSETRAESTFDVSAMVKWFH